MIIENGSVTGDNLPFDGGKPPVVSTVCAKLARAPQRM